MDSFLQWNDTWSIKYKDQIGWLRYPSFKVALNLFHQRGGTNIVETGTIRALNDAAGGGNSTLILGDYAQTYDKKFWTVDILPEAIALSREVCQGFDKNTQFITSDSLKFLKEFPEKIDLLYLDSMDCPEYDAADSPNLIASQQHQLNELKAAWDKLTDKSVVLLDDNNFENGGKCKLSIQFLLEKGWICLWSDKQVLWIRGGGVTA